MHVIAWICFIWVLFELIGQIIVALVREKTPTDRISRFIASLINLLPIYFFYMYLFGR